VAKEKQLAQRLGLIEAKPQVAEGAF
jgi:hypothetical protein